MKITPLKKKKSLSAASPTLEHCCIICLILSCKDVRNAQHWHHAPHSKPPDKLICCLHADIHKWETKTVASRYRQHYSPAIPYRNSSPKVGCLMQGSNPIPYPFPTDLFVQAEIELHHTQNNYQPSKNCTAFLS